MKDDQASEENLMGELDRMYRHVADLESGQGPVEHNDGPKEHGQISGREVPTHAKIIPFPGHRMHLVSEEPSEPSEAPEEELRQKRKPSYRLYLILGSFSLIFSIFVLLMIPLKEKMAPPSSEKGERHQLTVPVPFTITPGPEGKGCPPKHHGKTTKSRNNAASNLWVKCPVHPEKTLCCTSGSVS